MPRRKAGSTPGFGAANVGADYGADEVEFIKAMERWMRETGKRYPTFTEVLAVAKSLGWRKVADAVKVVRDGTDDLSPRKGRVG